MTVVVVGIVVSALLGVFAGACHLLRSDLKECRSEARANHRDINSRFDRLEAKLDRLILALGRAGFLVDPQAPQAPQPPSESQD